MDSLSPVLALAMLILSVVGAVVASVLFKRKPANRPPMENAPDDAIPGVRTPDQP